MAMELLLKVRNFLRRYINVYRPYKPYINEGRLRSLLRKSYRETYKLILVISDSIFLIPAVLVVFLVRVLRPVVLIRFFPLNNRRVGHFSGNTELYLCKRDIEIKQGKRSIDLFFTTWPISNQQLKKMWKRILHVNPLVSYLYRVNSCWPGGEENSVLELSKTDRDIHGLFAVTQPHLYFTPKEIERGNLALRKIGISPNSSYVCLYARDSKYLNDYYKVDFNYHNYRDSDIRNCRPVAERLVERGYFVIRMGKNVKEEFETNNSKIIDYAKNSRSDFLDIFLSANCKFFIGGPAGLTSVPMIFRRPIVWANFIPLELLPSWGKDDLLILKKLWLRREDRFLTFREILESGIGSFIETRQYKELGIDVVENTAAEILAVAIEMDERLKGTWQASSEDEELQERFRSLFRPSELHNKFLARIGAEFLRQNKELLG